MPTYALNPKKRRGQPFKDWARFQAEEKEGKKNASWGKESTRQTQFKGSDEGRTIKETRVVKKNNRKGHAEKKGAGVHGKLDPTGGNTVKGRL